jgi:hypothetical protein
LNEAVAQRSSTADRSTLGGNDLARTYAYTGVAFLCAAAVLIYGCTLAVPDDAQAAFVVTVFLAALMLGAVAFRFGRTGGDLFDPMLLISVVLTLYFVFHAMWVLVDPSRTNSVIRRPFMDEMTRSQTYFLLAYAVAILGYAVAKPWTPRATFHRKISDIPMATLLLVFLVGMGVNYVALKAGAYSKSATSISTLSVNIRVLRTIGFLSFVAYAAALVRITRDRPRRTERLTVYGFMLPMQIVWSFVTGTKSDALFAVLALLIVRNYRVRFLTVGRALASGAAFVVLVMPLIQTTRMNTAAGNLSSSSEIRKAVDRLPTEAKRVSHGPGLLDGVAILQARTNGSESFALATKYTPGLRDYQLGRAWVAIPLAFIPRFVWRGKPNYTPGRDFSEIYGGESLAAGNGLVLAPTFPGDLYMNFGVVGLLGGFLVLGALLRVFTQRDGIRADVGERRVFWYAVLIVSVVVLEQDVGELVSTTLLHAAAAAAFLAVCAPRVHWRGGARER